MRAARPARLATALALAAALAGCAERPTELTSPCMGEDAAALAFRAAPEGVSRRSAADCLFTPLGGP